MSVQGRRVSCYDWCSDFTCAHAIFASGFVTAPVAIVHFVKRPYSGATILFAAFAALCTTVSLILCCKFYAELRRPPWPRWLASASAEARHLEQQDGQETEVSSHEQLRHPEQAVMGRERDHLRAALVPSYEHPGGDAECAVCLGDVEKGEPVRRMPVCLHVFHTECIDRWLRSHATCPICRSSVFTPPERPPEVVLNVELALV